MIENICIRQKQFNLLFQFIHNPKLKLFITFGNMIFARLLVSQKFIMVQVRIVTMTVGLIKYGLIFEGRTEANERLVKLLSIWKKPLSSIYTILV